MMDAGSAAAAMDQGGRAPMLAAVCQKEVSRQGGWTGRRRGTLGGGE